MAREIIEESIVGLKYYHQEATLILVTAVQKLKVVTQAGKELKHQHQEAMLVFNTAVQQQHEEAKEKFNTVMQLIKATTSADINSLEGKGCHQPTVSSSNTSTPYASVQTDYFVTEAPTLMIT